jgi:transcriptional regulator with XRE-family HTH domain/energy-coupling factor transporter ATP-binding protein EcfA2
MRENHTELGSRLGMLRERTGLLQKDVARLVKVSHITVKNWENGHYKPSAEHLKSLLEVYLQQKAFSHDREQVEAEELWTMAALNVEFDREWWVEARIRQVSSIKQSRESSLAVDERGSSDSSASLKRASTLISEAAGPSSSIDERVVPGNSLPSRFGVLWEDFIVYMGNLSLKDQDRRRMLDKIQSMWIKGLLEESLQRVAAIELELSERPDAVANPWGQSFQEVHQPATKSASDFHILDAYEKAHGKLLILGEPGSGKTTLLLQLTQTLLERARRDDTHPIPVVFYLSSWIEKRQPITKWLVEELSAKYHISPALGQQWIDNNQLLPLFDGLDEVDSSHYTGCVEALNSYLKDHGLVPTVICSRNENYLNQSKRLLLLSAVVVQPLTEQKIETYLRNTGKRMEGLREGLDHDPGLKELAHTPLMLRVLTTIYEDGTVENAQVTSTASVQQRAFTTYIIQAFKRQSHARYTPEQTINWLRWLAQQLNKRNQSDFYIEFMQIDWLPEYWLRRLYPAFAVGLAYGILSSIGFGISYIPLFPLHYVILVILCIALFNTLLYGFFNGIIFGILAGGDAESATASPDHLHHAGIGRRVIAVLENRVVYGMLNGLLDGVLVGLLVNPVSGWICGIFSCAFCATLGKLDAEIRCAEYLSWSWSSMLRNAHKFLGGGLLVGFLYGLVTGRDYLFAPAQLLPSLLLGLGIGLLIGLLMSIRGGFTNKVPNVQKILKPNQGIRNSIRYSLFFALFFGIAFGLLFGLIYGPILFLILGDVYRNAFPANSGLIYGLSDGFLVGAFFWLLSGGIACIQHLLLRILLWRRGSIPWNYTRFLNGAADLGLLHRVGGGYVFFHRLLQEYFATLDGSAPGE